MNLTSRRTNIIFVMVLTLVHLSEQVKRCNCHQCVHISSDGRRCECCVYMLQGKRSVQMPVPSVSNEYMDEMDDMLGEIGATNNEATRDSEFTVMESKLSSAREMSVVQKLLTYMSRMNDIALHRQQFKDSFWNEVLDY